MTSLLEYNARQLFFLTFGLTLIFTFLFRVINPNFLTAKLVFDLASLSGFILAALWMSDIVTRFQHLVPTGEETHVRSFKIVVYVNILVVIVNKLVQHYSIVPQGILIITSMVDTVCYVYVCYRAATTLQTIERQTFVKFQDLILPFFGFFFYPIGLWFFQPRINKLYKTL